MDRDQGRWLEADVAIVGGGPAGVAAAIEARRSGLTAVVVDKATFPRDKCCGDGLTTDALRQLEALGLDPASVPSWRTITDVHVRSPGGREVVFPLPRRGHGVGGLFAAVARRTDLDRALLELARREGATVVEGHELTDLARTGTGLTVEARAVGDRSEPRRLVVLAPYVIGADGMWSPTRRLAGIDTDGYRGDWHAFRQYFTGVSGPAAHELMVWFEPDLLPGYVWAFPVDERSANVGFGVVRRPGTSVQFMRQRWAEVLARPHIVAALGPDAVPEGPHRAWPIPARLGRIPPTAGRVLLAGDACAATDPMTGEGIAQALTTGRLAVNALVTAGPGRPEVAERRYRAALAGGLERDHWLAARLSSVLRRPAAADAAIAVAGATAWTRRNFARWLFEDYPRAAVLTPRRWHRRLFSAPGAFDPRSSLHVG